MSEKRRDHKGRILRDGESQRADGKYRFSYVDILGKRKEVTSWRLDTVRISDAKAWLIKLQREDGKGYSTIHTVRGALRPAFQMAEDDDLKMLQYIMDHADISVTLNTYTHVQYEDAEKEMKRLYGIV